MNNEERGNDSSPKDKDIFVSPLKKSLTEPRKRRKTQVVTTRSGSRLDDRLQVRDDELGTYIKQHSELLQQRGWSAMIHYLRPRGDLCPYQRHWHPASPLLRHYAKCGVPAVLSTSPWEREQLEMRLERGSHQSCKGHRGFIREEMLSFVKQGYWMILPYRLVKHLKQLRLAPLGVVPQRDRRAMLIPDKPYP